MPRLCSGSHSDADDTTLAEVLYESENFIVINKRFDLKVNSDDENEVTVASILCRLYPSSVDEHASHGFRSASKSIEVLFLFEQDLRKHSAPSQKVLTAQLPLTYRMLISKILLRGHLAINCSKMIVKNI